LSSCILCVLWVTDLCIECLDSVERAASPGMLFLQWGMDMKLNNGERLIKLNILLLMFEDLLTIDLSVTSVLNPH